jgi:hypothetical protein
MRAIWLGLTVFVLGAGCGDDGIMPGDPGAPDTGGDCDPGRDLDQDGLPDCDDPDVNGDGVADRETPPGDLDGDGRSDADDPDIDGDGLSNWNELAPDGQPVDTDGDGEPDFRDRDADGDTISDGDEGLRDADGDGVPNFRDQDADGDGVGDAIEAGDDDPATPPVSCPGEIDERWEPTFDLVPPPVDPDGSPDYLDLDADGDGLPDGEELTRGSDRCGWDTDEDGASDLFEARVADLRCERESDPACGSLTNPERRPEDASFVFMNEEQVRTRRVTLGFQAAEAGDVRPAVEAVGREPALGRAFVTDSAPSCQWFGGASPIPDPPCWTPPAGTALEDAVLFVDGERYAMAVPGLEAEFTVRFENFHVSRTDRDQTFYVELVVPGTRHLFVILVPRRTTTPG